MITPMKKFTDTVWGLYRLHLFLGVAGIYFGFSFFIHFTAKDSIIRKQRFSRNANRFVKILISLFNIKVQVKNPLTPNTHGLIVGNHMGFVDILASNSIISALYVTSKEMKETPLIGKITEMAGCLFVERRNRANLIMELEEMIGFLRHGFRVVIFPEATSHNGEELLPFKRTLLTSAAFAGVPIIPYCINFVSVNGEPFSKKWRDSVCHYGKIPIHISIWKTLQLKEIVCEVEFLDPVFTTPEQDRGEVADSIRAMIVEKFRPVK